jgi:hypothetical protein
VKGRILSFFEDEEELNQEEFPEEEKPRRGRGGIGQGSPLARVLLILVAVIVLVLITSLGIRSCLNKKKVNEFRDYFDEVSQIVEQSDGIGAQISAMFQNPDEAVRQQLESKLAEYQNTQNQLVESASAIDPPDQFKQENEWFIASMQIRARGLNGLQPAILNALESKNNTAVAAQISHEMLILMAGDVVYEEFFIKPSQTVLEDESITDIKVPTAKFFDNPSLASQETAVLVLEKLKGGTAQVTGLHGVALNSVKAQPGGMTLEAGTDNRMKAAESLTFDVEVENQGESTETGVLVSLSLTAPGHPTPQKVEGYIDAIGPGEFQTIELSGLAAEAGEEPALLRAEAGPVAGEENTQNNSQEFSIIFE